MGYLRSEQNLSFLTWNATGIMSSCSYLCDILNKWSIDICGVSEHWLYEKDLYFLDCIDKMYRSHAVCDSGLNAPSARRVGKGGVAIFWHKRLDDQVSPLLIDEDRIVGIQLEIFPSEYIFVFQVYLPCTLLQTHLISVEVRLQPLFHMMVNLSR